MKTGIAVWVPQDLCEVSWRGERGRQQSGLYVYVYRGAAGVSVRLSEGRTEEKRKVGKHSNHVSLAESACCMSSACLVCVMVSRCPNLRRIPAGFSVTLLARAGPAALGRVSGGLTG
ncbi:hypothetical protein BaRGS_00033556 [Batillaria attramentaria]|uniref:Uncharacterized protein n=1 Tax=Batillaria attramentaria TaxID=370345 RepID=A0ABD0JKB8_9CAEN